MRTLPVVASFSVHCAARAVVARTQFSASYVKTTACVTVLRRRSTLFPTVGAHANVCSWVSRVSHGDDVTCAGTSLRILVAIYEFERAARPCSESRLPFLLSSFLSSFLSSLAGRSSVYLKSHHDY